MKNYDLISSLNSSMNKCFMKNKQSRYLSSFLQDGKCVNLPTKAAITWRGNITIYSCYVLVICSRFKIIFEQQKSLVRHFISFKLILRYRQNIYFIFSHCNTGNCVYLIGRLIRKHYYYFFVDFLIIEVGFSRWFPETHKNTTPHDVSQLVLQFKILLSQFTRKWLHNKLHIFCIIRFGFMQKSFSNRKFIHQ